MRGWSPEEDELLLSLIENSGKRWKLIAENLGKVTNAGVRTAAMVRNRYLRIERGRWLTEQGKSKNRCGQCGELKRGHVCRVPRALVQTDLSTQGARHAEARLAMGQEAPGTPNSSLGASRPLSLGVTMPLTMPLHPGGEPDGPQSLMSSPGPLSFLQQTGLSPFGVTPGLLSPLSAGPFGPPQLRAQSSMDILLQASDMHRNGATGATPTATPLSGTYDSNPFKLPHLTNEMIPAQLQDEVQDVGHSIAPPPPLQPIAPQPMMPPPSTEVVVSPRGCAEVAATASVALTPAAPLCAA